MIGQRLTMRASVERNTAVGTDSYGHPVAPVWTPLAVIPCFGWSPTARDAIDGDKVASIEDVRIMVGLGADLREDDEIAQIAGKSGIVLFPGRFRVDGPVQYKHNHLEAALRRVG